jgi:hypothetical protein
MNAPWEGDGALVPQGIVRVNVAAVPVRGEALSPSERKGFALFWKWLCPWLNKGTDLAEAFAEAKVAQENAVAQKTVAEAAEIQARTQHHRAQADVTKQEASKRFIDNIREIANLPDEGSRVLAFAKLMSENPEVAANLDQLQELLQHLRLHRGLMIEPVDTEASTMSPATKLRVKIGAVTSQIPPEQPSAENT